MILPKWYSVFHCLLPLSFFAASSCDDSDETGAPNLEEVQTRAKGVSHSALFLPPTLSPFKPCAFPGKCAPNKRHPMVIITPLTHSSMKGQGAETTINAFVGIRGTPHVRQTCPELWPILEDSIGGLRYSRCRWSVKNIP